MNITQAEAIASLYDELIRSVDKTKFKLPEGKWTHEHIDYFYLEGTQFTVKWERYAGCGEYEKDTTYEQLENLFN